MRTRTHPSRRTSTAAWLAALCLPLALSGCSGDTDQDASGTSSPTGSASSTGSSSPTASGSSSSSTSPSEEVSPTTATPSVDSGEDALASGTFTVTGTYSRVPQQMRFDIVELKRRGDLLDLVAHLTNTNTDRSQDQRWQVAQRFAGAYRDDITSTNGVFAGLVLTDVAGRKRYLVAADSGNNCVCTDNLSSTFVGAGQTVELTATYAAPPTSTTELDVTVPQLQVFRDVPIS